MCTSIVVNRRKTIIGWNLDLLDMEYRVRPSEDGVFIEINDAREGWMPLFGGNARGDFVGMPTCWPYDGRSDPKGQEKNIIKLDIELLLQQKTFQEIREIAENEKICSIPGTTFMSSLSDAQGNVMHIVPGQGCLYYEKPDHAVLTNFSPFKMDAEIHPWMGWDRYQKAQELLEETNEDFSAQDCLAILREVAQTVCPTVVSMVYDVTDRTICWCENRQWETIAQKRFD